MDVSEYNTTRSSYPLKIDSMLVVKRLCVDELGFKGIRFTSELKAGPSLIVLDMYAIVRYNFGR